MCIRDRLWCLENMSISCSLFDKKVQGRRGAGIACWLERQTHDRKFASSNPGKSGERIFFARVNFVCWLLFGVCSIHGFHPCVTAVARKRPYHSAKSASGLLHLNTHTPLAHRSRSGLTMPLLRQSVGIYQERAHTQLVREHSDTVVSAR